MNIRRLTLGVYALCVLSLLLPWFTYNGAVMGYCRGVHFLGWLAVPLVVLGVCLVRKGRGAATGILSELSILSCLSILVLAFGLWEQVYNIRWGFQWQTGLYTAQFGYWVSAVLFLALFLLVQLSLFRKDANS